MRTRILSTAMIAVTGLALSACQSNDGLSHVPESYMQGSSFDRYDLSATQKTEMIEIALQPGDSQLRREEIYKLEAFLSLYKSNGHGPLLVSIPDGQVNEQLVISAAAEIRDITWNAGVEYDQIDGSAYDAGSQATAPILIAFTRYLADRPDCPTWASIDAADGTSNNDTPVLGCAVRTNMAAMIADPADLLGVRVLDEDDTGRRQEQLQRWRLGQTTNAERSDDETGNVSSAVE